MTFRERLQYLKSAVETLTELIDEVSPTAIDIADEMIDELKVIRDKMKSDPDFS